MVNSSRSSALGCSRGESAECETCRTETRDFVNCLRRHGHERLLAIFNHARRSPAPLRFTAGERDIDESDADGVRVHIRAAGICHSDAHYRAGAGKTSLPLTLGHEVAGVTDDGERVAIHYLLPNGDMIGKEADGGYAESIVVPAANLIPIPDEVPFDEAAIRLLQPRRHSTRYVSLPASRRPPLHPSASAASESPPCTAE